MERDEGARLWSFVIALGDITFTHGIFEPHDLDMLNFLGYNVTISHIVPEILEFRDLSVPAGWAISPPN